MSEEEITSADAFELREASGQDGEALRELHENNPDTGEIGFAPRFEVNPYELYSQLSQNLTGFVAETPDGEPVGAGYVSLDEARVGGALRPRAYLAGVVVHRDYRGLGLGKRLAAERIRHAEAERGDDVVITAAIQSGNEASESVAKSWADGFPYKFAMEMQTPRAEPPATGYEIRPLREAEVPAFVDHINEFYSDAELYSPYDPEQLTDWLEGSILDEPVHRCAVVVADDELVAGAHVLDLHKLQWVSVDDLPPELEGADELPPSIPESREIRPRIAVPWYVPGHADAVSDLVRWVRATAGEANRIMFGYDPDGPIAALDAFDPDAGAVETNWAIRGLEDPLENAVIAPSLGW